MREWCGCGAGINGKVKQVKVWRKTHRHDPVEQPPQVPPTGASSQVEMAYSEVDHVIGFRRQT